MKTVCRSRSIPTLAEVNGVKPFQMGLGKGRSMLTQDYRHYIKMK